MKASNIPDEKPNMFTLIFMFFVSLASGQTLPYFVKVESGVEQIKLVEIKYHAVKYDTIIDTTFYDSTFVCSGASCIWQFDTLIRASFDTIYVNRKGVWQYGLKYSFFDAENDSCQIFPWIQPKNDCVGATFEEDTVWGDIFSRPGTGKEIYFRFSGKMGSCNDVSIYLMGVEVGNPDSMFRGRDYIFRLSLPKRLSTIKSLQKSPMKYFYNNHSEIELMFGNSFPKRIILYDMNGNILKDMKNITEAHYTVNVKSIVEKLFIMGIQVDNDRYFNAMIKE